MTEVGWIKSETTMFDDEKIQLVQAIPESDAIIVIWIRLLILAGKTSNDGLIYIQRSMPYTEKMLATLFGKNVNTVRLALTALANFNMIDLGSDGLVAISNWEKHQNTEGMSKIRLKNAGRNRKCRERKRQERLKLENSVNMMSRSGIDKDIEEDVDIDKEEKKGKYSDEHLRLAKELQSSLIEDFPEGMNKVDTEKWADAIRSVEEGDKASIEAIKYVISWLSTDEFWFGGIRSAKKLWEKSERLKFEIKAGKNNHKKQSRKLQYSNPSEYGDLPV